MYEPHGLRNTIEGLGGGGRGFEERVPKSIGPGKWFGNSISTMQTPCFGAPLHQKRAVLSRLVRDQVGEALSHDLSTPRGSADVSLRHFEDVLQTFAIIKGVCGRDVFECTCTLDDMVKSLSSVMWSEVDHGTCMSQSYFPVSVV